MSHRASRRRFLLLGAAALSLPAWSWADADEFTGFPGTRLRFAAADAARALLITDDDYTAAAGDVQRRAVLGSAAPVSREAFLRWNGDAARAWTGPQRERWLRALRNIAPAWAALRIPLPPDVVLIATSGAESANAPYTRANAVVLAGPAAIPGYSDEMLIAHELWHVASRHAPELATRLYAEIGFEPVPALEFPAAWAALRIANPDAPGNRHAMRLNAEGRQALVTPVLVASRGELRPGESFFDVMECRLLEILPDPAAGVSRAVMRGDQPVWHRLDGNHDYLRRLGGNTGYVIHCEEAMADNIALIATGRPARNPALLERIRAALPGASPAKA